MDLPVKFELLEPSGLSGAGCPSFYPIALRLICMSHFTYGVCAVTKINKLLFVFVCVCVGGGGVAAARQHLLL
jgi:hypothetical protein